MSLKYLTLPTKSLSQSITSASMTFKVNNIKSFALNSLGQNINLTSADFGTQAFCVFRNDLGTRIEIMEFDPATIASTSITILRRGLGFSGDLTTETATYKLDWPAGSKVQFGTDAPQIFQYLKEYIDAASIAGAVDATTVAKGIVEKATDAQVTANTEFGETGATLFVHPGQAPELVSSAVTIEVATTDTHSLTTVANEKVIVIAKGDVENSTGGNGTVVVQYNGVTKDTCVSVDGGTYPFALMYTETPGAATQNITLVRSTPAGMTLTNIKIIIIKIKG